jgi:hypothetical protein
LKCGVCSFCLPRATLLHCSGVGSAPPSLSLSANILQLCACSLGKNPLRSTLMPFWSKTPQCPQAVQPQSRAHTHPSSSCRSQQRSPAHFSKEPCQSALPHAPCQSAEMRSLYEDGNKAGTNAHSKYYISRTKPETFAATSAPFSSITFQLLDSHCPLQRIDSVAQRLQTSTRQDWHHPC